MRLINAETLELVDFGGRQPSAYAILSHTWSDDEVSFLDFQDLPRASAKKGFRKIKETCRLALDRGLSYAWVDTCCIDKSSSAELSEAINSMFRWYQASSICFAYLEDVHHIPSTDMSTCAAFPKSRWFKRGWTLQELLGPAQLLFYDSDWTTMAFREAISEEVSKITNTDRCFLSRSSGTDIARLLANASVAERISWASQRETTRDEDMAYCLLGIFGINLPLLYGEGNRAFLRLQEEIIKRSDDQSIFAWTDQSCSRNRRLHHHASLLAPSPVYFSHSAHIVCRRTGTSNFTYAITNRGLQITLPMLKEHAVLACGPRDDPTTLVALRLSKVDGNLWRRPAKGSGTGFVDQRAWQQWTKASIFIATTPEWGPETSSEAAWECSFSMRRIPTGLEIGKGWSGSLGRRWDIPTNLLNSGKPLRYYQTLKPSSYSGIVDSIHVTLEARRLDFLKSPFRDLWVTYELSRHPGTEPCLNPESCSYQMGGTRFLTMADGRVVCAKIAQRDVHGEHVAVVDIVASQPGYQLVWRRLSALIGLIPLRLLVSILDTTLPIPQTIRWVVLSCFFFMKMLLSDKWLMSVAAAPFVLTPLAHVFEEVNRAGGMKLIVRQQIRTGFQNIHVLLVVCLCHGQHLRWVWPLYRSMWLQWQYHPRYKNRWGNLESPYSGQLTKAAIESLTSFLILWWLIGLVQVEIS